MHHVLIFLSLTRTSPCSMWDLPIVTQSQIFVVMQKMTISDISKEQNLLNETLTFPNHWNKAKDSPAFSV